MAKRRFQKFANSDPWLPRLTLINFLSITLTFSKLTGCLVLHCHLSLFYYNYAEWLKRTTTVCRGVWNNEIVFNSNGPQCRKLNQYFETNNLNFLFITYLRMEGRKTTIKVPATSFMSFERRNWVFKIFIFQ